MEKPVRSMYMDIIEQRALGEGLYRVTIAASEKIRQPPELDFAGLSTENYIRNPVVMWAHDAVGRSPSGGLPIGRTVKLSSTPDGRIVADFEFLDDDPFAQRVKNAWDKGFLRAASVSWVPYDSVPVEGGWRDVKSDLLEWSIVSVPADPGALRDAHLRMIDEIFSQFPANGPGSPTTRQSLIDENEPDEGSYTLSTEEFGELNTALTLLREVVATLKGVGRLSESKDNPVIEGDVSEDDLSEIRQLVGAVKGAMLAL